MSMKAARADLQFFLEGTTTPVAGSDGSPVTLAAGTYYVDLKVEDVSLAFVHWMWSSALAATITYEFRGFPDVHFAVAASGGSWKDAGITTTITAGTAEGKVEHFADDVAPRMRAKIVVTVQGTLRGRAHGKGI